MSLTWLGKLRPWYRVFKEAVLGDATVLAAGVAMFMMMAAIPFLAAMVTLYGLIADPASITAQLDGLSRVLPSAVVVFLSEQLTRVAERSGEHLGIALVTTLGLALYSARSAASAMRVGLNFAYGVTESRHPFRTFLFSFGTAVAMLVGCSLLAAIVIGLPTLLELVRPASNVSATATILRWPILLLVLTFGLVLLYRTAPSLRAHDHRRLWPGAIVATSLWLVVSWALSMWVDRVADYEILYGAFASVLVLILWLYVSALSVILGGLVNAELERADRAAMG